jgi:hypothetical protein
MTEGKSSVLPMTNALVRAWEQCHSYTEVIKGRCLKDIKLYCEILSFFKKVGNMVFGNLGFGLK